VGAERGGEGILKMFPGSFLGDLFSILTTGTSCNMNKKNFTTKCMLHSVTRWKMTNDLQHKTKKLHYKMHAS
jgi:hypothetical protein